VVENGVPLTILGSCFAGNASFAIVVENGVPLTILGSCFAGNASFSFKIESGVPIPSLRVSSGPFPNV